MTPLALTRYDVANYVNALFLVYIGLIFCNILLSYVPRMPYRPWLRPILDFITDTTNPFLITIRRFIPRFGGAGGFAMDFSPMVGTLLLILVSRVVVGLIEG